LVSVANYKSKVKTINEKQAKYCSHCIALVIRSKPKSVLLRLGFVYLHANQTKTRRVHRSRDRALISQSVPRLDVFEGQNTIPLRRISLIQQANEKYHRSQNNISMFS